MSARSGGWRVALRLARREAMRRRGQTVLMLVLICLPVVAVTAAAVVWRTQDVSAVEGLDRRMGAAEVRVETSGFARIVQAPDPQDFYTAIGAQQEYPAPGAIGRDDLDRVLDVLGGDRPAVPLATSTLGFRTDEGVGDAETIGTDLASPLTDGLLEPVSGKYPPGPGEVVVNQALADRGPSVGETLTVVRKTAKGEVEVGLRIVGIAESMTSRTFPTAAALPGSFGADPAAQDLAGWLVGGDPVSWDDVRALNAVGVSATSRQVIADPPLDSELPTEVLVMDEGLDEVTLSVLALVVAMVLLEVVLLVGPAFAVRAKAQAHTLALVAAAGGTPRQARRTVLASGVTVGVVGGAAGVVLGIGVGALGVPIAQRFDGSRFGPFDVPWPLLLLVAAFGFVSAVLAAVVPAHSASRQDVVAVLAGRRGEGRASVRSPILGLALLGVGVAGSVAGGAAGSGGGSAAVLIAGSAIVSVVGMILLVPLAVGLVARLAARLPLPLRFAARDAARHRTRTVPAVAAVGATVAGVVTLGIAVASDEAANAERYVPMLQHGYASVTLGDAEREAVDAVLDRSLPPGRAQTVRGVQTLTDDGELELQFLDGADPVNLSYWSTLGTPYLVGEELPSYVDVPDAARSRTDAVLADGGVVLLNDDNVGELGPVPDVSRLGVEVRRYDPDGGESELVKDADAPAATARVEGTSPAVAVLSPRLAKQLDLDTFDAGMVIPAPISAEAERDIEEGIAALGESSYFYVERGFQTDPAVRIIQGVLALLGAILMLGGTLTATFLALSDARPDLSTMAAVGARPRTRRRVAAGYALVVGGVGALLGAPVGLIPGIAISRPLTRDWETGTTALDVPWLLITVVVIGLPLLTAAVVGACARGRLPLAARLD